MSPAVVPPSPPVGSEEGAEGRNGAGGSSPGGTATLQQPRRNGSPAGSGHRARRAPTGRSPSAGPAANEEEATRAAERGAAVPDGEAAALPVAARRSAATLLRLLSQISPNRREVAEATALGREGVTILLEAFRKQKNRFQSIEVPEAGVSCQRLKIAEPNKFGVLLEMPVEALELYSRDDSGVFFDLKFREGAPKEKYLLEFLDEDKKLSACKMLNALKSIIKRKVQTKGFLKQAGEKLPGVAVTLENRRKPGSPAITLQITQQNTEPPAEISVDLILTLKAEKKVPLPQKTWLESSVWKSISEKPLHLVPRGDYWQLSFSHIEKLMMEKHGSSRNCCGPSGAKCCRQECLLLLKYFLEKLKMEFPAELAEFSWHHIQTAFFHSCVQYPNDSAWRNNLELCYQRVLKGLLPCLRASRLPHFFVPSFNLLSQEHQESNAFLAGQIEAELKRF